MNRMIIVGCIIILIFQGCLKTELVSPVPHITFKSLQLFDAYDSSLGNNIKIGVLNFEFKDGDADFGLDTTGMNSKPVNERYNVFLFPYKKENGKYIKIAIDTTDSNNPPPFYRIIEDPKLDRVGQNKTVEGTITINIDYFIIPPYDSMRYMFYITDRAMNQSNIDSTTDIGFR